MLFSPNPDQAALSAMLDKVMASVDAGWKASADWQRFDWSANLDATLEENGVYDCAREETLGAVAAASLTYRLGTLPVLVECAASSLLRPLVAPDLPRPVAVMEDDGQGAVRFLPVARSVIHLGESGMRWAALPHGTVTALDSPFAYPIGSLAAEPLQWTSVAADPRAARERWRVAVAAELAGALEGGLDAVLDHVRNRVQFGRPLGSFQAIQHRLAEAAVHIEAGLLLTLKAAQTADATDSATALAYVQDASAAIVYDLHQFMGAMGLTLEHPLHRWTYRAKLLRSSLGGAQENQKLVASRRWGS